MRGETWPWILCWSEEACEYRNHMHVAIEFFETVSVSETCVFEMACPAPGSPLFFSSTCSLSAKLAARRPTSLPGAMAEQI